MSLLTGKNRVEGQPCDHPGCLSHVSHPCEGCGRIGGRATKYIAWVTQNGAGCDHTIGCGCNLYDLKAQTDQEAEAEVGGMVTASVHREWAERYESIIVYEVASARQVDAVTLYKEEEARLAGLAARKTEQVEKALYERLKSKYDTGGG